MHYASQPVAPQGGRRIPLISHCMSHGISHGLSHGISYGISLGMFPRTRSEKHSEACLISSDILKNLKYLWQARCGFHDVALDMFSSDIDSACKRTILANYTPQKFFDDACTRDPHEAGHVDLYTGGFPCQSFSRGGKMKGFHDTRGRLVFVLIAHIDMTLPKAFILENVSDILCVQGATCFQTITDSLRAAGNAAYNVHHHIMDTRLHGIPQSRRRMYWVGILKTLDNGSFEFPKPIACMDIEATPSMLVVVQLTST